MEEAKVGTKNINETSYNLDNYCQENISRYNDIRIAVHIVDNYPADKSQDLDVYRDGSHPVQKAVRYLDELELPWHTHELRAYILKKIKTTETEWRDNSQESLKKLEEMKQWKKKINDNMDNYIRELWEGEVALVIRQNKPPETDLTKPPSSWGLDMYEENVIDRDDVPSILESYDMKTYEWKNETTLPIILLKSYHGAILEYSGSNFENWVESFREVHESLYNSELGSGLLQMKRSMRGEEIMRIREIVDKVEQRAKGFYLKNSHLAETPVQTFHDSVRKMYLR